MVESTSFNAVSTGRELARPLILYRTYFPALPFPLSRIDFLFIYLDVSLIECTRLSVLLYCI